MTNGDNVCRIWFIALHAISGNRPKGRLALQAKQTLAKEYFRSRKSKKNRN